LTQNLIQYNIAVAVCSEEESGIGSEEAARYEEGMLLGCRLFAQQQNQLFLTIHPFISFKKTLLPAMTVDIKLSVEGMSCGYVVELSF
jgi:hypothetical protein